MLGLLRFGIFLFVKIQHQCISQSHLAAFSPFTLGNVAFYPRIVISVSWQPNAKSTGPDHGAKCDRNVRCQMCSEVCKKY